MNVAKRTILFAVMECEVSARGGTIVGGIGLRGPRKRSALRGLFRHVIASAPLLAAAALKGESMQQSRPHFVRGVLFALIGGVSWALSGTCAEFLFESQHLSPAWITSVRCLVAGIIFLLVALVFDRERLAQAARCKRAWASFAVNGLFGIVFCQFTYLTAISYTNSGTTTVLSMVGLALVMGYSCRASHRLPRKRELFGLLLTLVGVVLIATHGDVSRLAMPLPGLVWGLLSALGLAAYNILPIKLIGRYGSLVTMGASMLIAGVCMCFIEQPWTIPVDFNVEVLSGLAAIIVVGTVVAAWVYMQAIADIGPVKASMIAAVEPVAATVFTVAFLGTRFEPVDLLGFACIIVMVLLVSSKPDDEQKLAEELAGKTGVEDVVAPRTPSRASDGTPSAARGAEGAASDSALACDASPSDEPVVLWDPAVSKKAQERANNGELTLEEMICSPEAAHLVDVKSNTKDTVAHGTRERIALATFAVLIVAGFAALTTYISAGHSLNYASTSIDDITGDMSGYGVVLFEGTVETTSSQSLEDDVQDASGSNSELQSSEVADAVDVLESEEASDSESQSDQDSSAGQTVKSFVKKALGLDALASLEASSSESSATSASKAASEASGVTREAMTIDAAKATYEAKSASVVTLDVEDIDQYKFGRIVMKGGHTYGIVSLASDEIAGLHLPLEALSTKTTITKERESVGSANSSTTKTKTKDAYASVSELLASVDPDEIDEELVDRVEDVIDHFRTAGVDIVIVLTTDTRPLAAIEGADVVITVRSDARFAQSQMVGKTLYVDTPETDSVGALLVAPGNVVSSRVLTGEATSSASGGTSSQ